MTDEQINAAIETVLHRNEHWIISRDYCTDLNAMHEAEMSLLISKFPTYVKKLTKINFGDPITAGARQRAEAFLRTLGKWEEALE